MEQSGISPCASSPGTGKPLPVSFLILPYPPRYVILNQASVEYNSRTSYKYFWRFMVQPQDFFIGYNKTNRACDEWIAWQLEPMDL